ncbi:uncharacterized protein LOC117336140 [Pecten maximus]|uniref:uncharacterized protein LOC117336140 n=1 Tax=Pecten maximus TaxID=6579 RepID=UPI001458D3D6|nr:uncharacterized protein LOC117336140 [Pecten maximus]
MATHHQLDPQTGLDLQDFRGSAEEKTVKRILKFITAENIVSPASAFINLVIHTSNASDGTSFSDAYVSLQISYELQEAIETDYDRGCPESKLVYLKDILNISILKNFQTCGVDAIEGYPDVCQQAFLRLLEFLREKKNHEKAIQKLLATTAVLSSGNKETHIMAGLAHHLFSQLVPGKKYEVDKYANQLPKECDCGCKAKICEGDTSVGSWRTWYGRVDIVLNHTIAVAFWKIKTNDAEEDNVDEDEPQRKRRNKETNDSCDICEEVETLTDLKVLKQILAEAVTNGFAQVNKDKNTLSHLLIPTFGATADHVSICLYDPESDCLLHSNEELDLWYSKEAGKLNVNTIIVIWLFLNFTIFTKKQVAALLDLDKSGIHDDLKEHLKYYRNAVTKANLVSRTPSGRPWENANLLVKSMKDL